jgi:hypothetical protein
MALLALGLLLALYRARSGDRLGEVRIGAAPWVMVDFRTVVYYPAKAFADGVNPYDAKVYLARYPAPLAFRGYPPALLAASRPFGWLSFHQAAGLQIGITFALFGVLAWVSLTLSGVRPTFSLLTAMVGLLLLSRPGHWNLLLGQPTLIMVLGVYAALVLPKRRVVWAGIALAVTMLKPTYGLPLAVLMLFLDRWKAVLVGGVITTLVNLAVLAMLASRSGGYREAISLIRSGERGVDASTIATQFSAFRIDAIAMVSRFAGHSLGLVVAFLIAGSLLGLAAFALRRRIQAGPEAALDPLNAGVACTAILICVYHVGYDTLLLVWPATALIVGIVRAGASGMRERIQLGLLLVLGLNWLSTYTVLEAIGFETGLALAVISLNSIALAGLFAAFVSAALARAPSPG